MRRLALVAALLALGTAGAQAADCMVPMEQASAGGRLQRGKTQDAAGRSETAFILELKQPACMTGSDDYDDVRGTVKIHVYSTDAKVLGALGQAVGKVVQVTGKPFGAHTAHHHAHDVRGLRFDPAAFKHVMRVGRAGMAKQRTGLGYQILVFDTAVDITKPLLIS